MRPEGSFGPIAQAMLHAARQQPGEVKALAHRANVGLQAARYTATRLVQAGALAPISEGRPVVLGVAERCNEAPPNPAINSVFAMLDAAFWGQG